jgi:hypothetical protein
VKVSDVENTLQREVDVRFAKRVFMVAGVWGLLVLSPLYFTFDLIGRLYPPPITHPDLYFGFVGLGIAWQVAFLVIARDPVRFHTMMIPAIVEKFAFVASVVVLYVQGRVQLGQLAVAAPDCVLGTLFVVSYFLIDDAQRR